MTSARASVDAETAPSAHRSYSQRSLPLMRSEYRRHLPPRGEQHEQLGLGAAPAAERAVRAVHERALEGRHGPGLARAGMRPGTGLSRHAVARRGVPLSGVIVRLLRAAVTGREPRNTGKGLVDGIYRIACYGVTAIFLLEKKRVYVCAWHTRCESAVTP